MIPILSARLPIRLLQDAPRSQKLQCSIEQITKPLLRPFSSTTPVSSNIQKKKRQLRDKYSTKAKQARVNANIALQAKLKVERAEDFGDAVRGAKEPTPFIKSLDPAMGPTLVASQTLPPTPESEFAAKDKRESTEKVIRPNHLNHFLTPAELDSALRYSKQLSTPYVSQTRDRADPEAEAKAKKLHDHNHFFAYEAIQRIVAVENASSAQKTRINTQRCIDEFGRHNTDRVFESRKPKDGEEGKVRVGPDTGSSEVQIAVLTTKIKRVADELKGKTSDKHNKRNLRVLLHRRQALLKYLWRKDRGGERWQHCISTLGLTPATWEGEIVVR